MTRIALITGGDRGLGRASALALAAHDTDIVLTYRAAEAQAAAVVAEIEGRGRRAVALRLDTTDDASFAAFADALRAALGEWGREDVDILMNNAGFAFDTPFGQTDPDRIDDLYRVHVKGPILLTELLAPMIADGGRVLFVSSGLTKRTNPIYSVYASMKGAIEIYTRYTARALAPRGITVNAIAPGATATDFAGGLIRDNQDYQRALVANHPMGRVGEPDDIGRAVPLLLSEDAGWLTGERIEVSGGQML